MLEYYPNYSGLLGCSKIKPTFTASSILIWNLSNYTYHGICILCPTEENSNTHLRCISQINQTYNKHSKERKVVTVTRDIISVIPCVATSLGVSYPITLH